MLKLKCDAHLMCRVKTLFYCHEAEGEHVTFLTPKKLFSSDNAVGVRFPKMYYHCSETDLTRCKIYIFKCITLVPAVPGVLEPRPSTQRPMIYRLFLGTAFKLCPTLYGQSTYHKTISECLLRFTFQDQGLQSTREER